MSEYLPENEIDIADDDDQQSDQQPNSHHLYFDTKKKRWTLRITIDCGSKFIGRPIRVRFKADDLQVAIIKRDAIISMCKAIGLIPCMRAQSKPARGATRSI